MSCECDLHNGWSPADIKDSLLTSRTPCSSRSDVVLEVVPATQQSHNCPTNLASYPTAEAPGSETKQQSTMPPAHPCPFIPSPRAPLPPPPFHLSSPILQGSQNGDQQWESRGHIIQKWGELPYFQCHQQFLYFVYPLYVGRGNRFSIKLR